MTAFCCGTVLFAGQRDGRREDLKKGGRDDEKKNYGIAHCAVHYTFHGGARVGEGIGGDGRENGAFRKHTRGNFVGQLSLDVGKSFFRNGVSEIIITY